MTKGDTGKQATSPWAMGWTGWKQVLVRTWGEAGEDNVGLIAAGVAFYGFLALVPLLGAIVLSYGLIAEPDTVVRNMKSLTSVMPADAAKLIGEQLLNVVTTSGSKKGFGLLLALGVALFGARNGASAVMTALNVAYEEKEKRSFLIVNLTALAITAGAVIVAIVAVLAIGALGHLESLIPGAPGFVLVLGKLLSYALLLLGGAAGAATLYRYGPSRTVPKWVWLTPGSLLFALFWVALTLGFGIYVANFGNYNATYGSLGAVVVMLTWLYLSSYLLIFGGELNSELEHQTAQDTTAGPAKPIGARGAGAADHVADGSEATSNGPAMSPAPSRTPVPASPSLPGEWLAARATSRVGHSLGMRKAGLIASSGATVGLALIRRPGRAMQGAAVLATAAALAWLGRGSDEQDPTQG